MNSQLEKFIKDYKNKKVLIMGLGLQGRGVQDAAFFCRIGARVTVTDLKTEEELKTSLEKLRHLPIEYVLGKHRNEDFINTDVVLRNADVPYNSSYLLLARRKNIPIEMDESLFSKYAKIKLIGITGTRGKSTTTNVIYEILKQAKLPVWLGGNILGKATLPLLSLINNNDYLVAELSSWQLQGFKEAHLSPKISIITNVYEDHLNRYRSMDEYIDDKKAIFKFQRPEDYLLLNGESQVLREISKEVKSKIIWFSSRDLPKKLTLKIRGEHNKANFAAAIKTAEILRIDKKIIYKSLADFKGLPYRLETISTIDGVEYVNDTTSTTPIAGVAAINSFNQPIILIAGGSSKKLYMDDFIKAIIKKVKKVIFLQGSETENLINLLQKYKGSDKNAGKFNNFRKAIIKAKSLANRGDIVLLSPGCPSFGMFKNEFDRGERFNKIVLNLQ